MDEKFIALTQEWHTKGWNARQSEIDELKAQLECCRKENAVLLGRVGELQGQLKTWKGQSMSAMIHGTCSCGEPWQRVISDREGFSLLHCFNCNNNRYENKEYFGDHEPKTLRGAND